MQYTFITLAFAALAAAQNTGTTTSTVPLVDNPNTHLLTLTNSNGVITGMATAVTSQPSVVTSQPAVETAQPEAASIYAGLPEGLNTVVINGNSTLTVSVSGTHYSVVKTTSTPTKSATGSGASGANASGSRSAGAGAAATMQAA